MMTPEQAEAYYINYICERTNSTHYVFHGAAVFVAKDTREQLGFVDLGALHDFYLAGGSDKFVDNIVEEFNRRQLPIVTQVFPCRHCQNGWFVTKRKNIVQCDWCDGKGYREYKKESNVV